VDWWKPSGIPRMVNADNINIKIFGLNLKPIFITRLAGEMKHCHHTEKAHKFQILELRSS
jgi:hypothetical protein